MRSIASDFSAAASRYERHAILQHVVLRELAELVERYVPDNAAILDAGSGTGMLSAHWPHANIIGLDIAEGMCRYAAEKYPQHLFLVADMAALPFADESMGMVFSSFAAQWLQQPEMFIKEAYRVVLPQGIMACAVPAEGTLQTLKRAYESAALPVPVLDFQNVERWREMLDIAGWEILHMKQVALYTAHRQLSDLLRHFTLLGANHKSLRGIRTPGQYQRLQQAYGVHMPPLPQTQVIGLEEKGEPQVYAEWEVLYVMAQKRA